jgi:hypothetical protein
VNKFHPAHAGILIFALLSLIFDLVTGVPEWAVHDPLLWDFADSSNDPL